MGLPWSPCSSGDGRQLVTFRTWTLGYIKPLLPRSMHWTELASRPCTADVLLTRLNMVATMLARTGTVMPVESWIWLIIGFAAPVFLV